MPAIRVAAIFSFVFIVMDFYLINVFQTFFELGYCSYGNWVLFLPRLPLISPFLINCFGWCILKDLIV